MKRSYQLLIYIRLIFQICSCLLSFFFLLYNIRPVCITTVFSTFEFTYLDQFSIQLYLLLFLMMQVGTRILIWQRSSFRHIYDFKFCKQLKMTKLDITKFSKYKLNFKLLEKDSSDGSTFILSMFLVLHRARDMALL